MAEEERPRSGFEVAITALTQKHVFLPLIGVAIIWMGVANIEDLVRIISTTLAGLRGCP